MPAYVVLDVEVTDPVAFAQYKELGPPSVAAFGGRYLARGGKVENLEGSWLPSRFVIIEFPSEDVGRAWWASTEYGPAKAIRQACARTEMLLVEGLTPPPR